MPSMGKPTTGLVNPYSGARKYRGPNDNLSQLKKMDDKGKYLNSLAGNKKFSGESSLKVVDGAKHSTLGKDGFLRLLMNQLSHQDPFKPVDQNKMAADLAQFSQLEQMSNMNKTLEKTLEDNLVKKKFFAASFLGKKVMTRGASVRQYGEGEVSYINFKTPKEVNKGLIRIYDQRKQVISQIELGAKSSGVHSIAWDGKQLDGMSAGKGIYTFQVRAWDRLNNEIPVETQAEGVVTGVDFDDHGEPVVTVEGKRVYLRDVKGFSLSKGEESMARMQYQLAEKGGN